MTGSLVAAVKDGDGKVLGQTRCLPGDVILQVVADRAGRPIRLEIEYGHGVALVCTINAFPYVVAPFDTMTLTMPDPVPTRNAMVARAKRIVD